MAWFTVLDRIYMYGKNGRDSRGKGRRDRRIGAGKGTARGKNNALENLQSNDAGRCIEEIEWHYDCKMKDRLCMSEVEDLKLS